MKNEIFLCFPLLCVKSQAAVYRTLTRLEHKLLDSYRETACSKHRVTGPKFLHNFPVSLYFPP